MKETAALPSVNDDLELDSESNTGSAQATTVRKNIPLKLKGKARGRGRRSTRARKVPTKKSAPHPPTTGFGDDDDEAEESTESSNKKFDIGEDISKLEAPTFTTLERGLPEPVHQNKKLRWDHRVHLIGEKVMNPMIHCCGKCALPILMYGRMIPCKHVFCFECARKAEKTCPKCKEAIHRVEPSKLGTVFMCTFGGPRHGTGGCRRTYLSQRDLQAHINHRHMRTAVTHTSTTTTHTQLSHPTQATSNISTSTTVQKAPHLASGRDPRDPRTHLVVETVHASHTPPQSSHPIPPASSHQTHLHPHLPPEHREPSDSTRPTSGLGSPVASSRSSHPYQHTSTTTAHMHGSYPSTIPSVSTRPNLITVPIQDDSTTSNQHVHVQSHQSQYSPAAASQTHQLPPLQHQNTNNAYSSHHYQPHPSPTSSYSPVPPVTYGTSLSTQSFNPAPPTHMPPPPMHNANAAMYPNPPPSVHHPQQSSPYSAPPLGGVSHSLPPQRFSSSSSYDENYSSQGWASGVPPPSRNPHSNRAMQGPQNSPNVGILQQCGQEPGFRGSYYQ